MEIIDEYSMRQASIFELRNMARDMGVNSPTVLKKEELIDKMLKIIKGEEKPQMPKSRQGRPPKQTLAISNKNSANANYENMFRFREKIIAENSTDALIDNSATAYNFNTCSYGGSWMLASSSFVYGEEKEQKQTYPCIKEEKGYFYTTENGISCVFEIGRTSDIENVAFVPGNLINAYELKPGDLIEFVSRRLTSGSIKYLTTVKLKNNNKNIKQEREDFSSFKMIDSNKKQNYFKNLKNLKPLENTYIGTRNVIFSSSLSCYSELINSFDSATKDYVVVNLCLDALPEDIAVFNKLENFENFYTILGDSEKQNSIMTGLALERVKRLAEMKINTIFLINDIKKIIKYKNLILGNKAYEFKPKTLIAPYQLITVGRNLEIGTTITTYALYKKDKDLEENDSLFKKEIENMGTYIFDIDCINNK